MYQFECPECKSPIYSKRPKESGGYRCLMCGYSAAMGASVPPAQPEPAQEAAPEPAVDAPALPEEWEIGRQLGKGGMGQVISAIHKLTGEQVAIKALLGEHVHEPQYAQRFAREVQVLHKLSHPNVVRLLYSGIYQGRPWLALELVEGATLREKMLDGPMRPRDAVRFTLQIAKALDYTHGRGVVHRDLKPENVLLDKEETPKVTDFGLAGLRAPEQGAARLTRVGMVMGTLEYMAPEQMNDTSVAGPPADIYSLGVMLFEMLAGRKPHGTESPAADVTGLPRGLEQLTVRMLDRAPLRRPSASEAVAELEQIGQKLTGSAIAPTPVQFGNAEPAAARSSATVLSNVKPPTAPPSAVSFGEAPQPKQEAPPEKLVQDPEPVRPEERPELKKRVPSSVEGPLDTAALRPAQGDRGLEAAPAPTPAAGSQKPIAIGAGAVAVLGLAGFLLASRGATPPPPPPVAVQAEAPVPQSVSLRLDSSPQGARIFDSSGQDLGKRTPAVLDNLKKGPTTFVLKLDGYVDNVLDVDVGKLEGAVAQMAPRKP